MAQLILTGETLAAGLRSDFEGTWRQTYDGVEEALSDAMQLGVPSDKLTELYAYRETAPYPERWDRGDPRPREGMASKGFSVTNYKYAKAIDWHRDDRMDNQVGSLETDARQLGAHFASIPSRIFYEIITDSPDLLPVIPNAPDGQPIYSGVDETGGARFGRTGGNIVTGTGVADSAAVTADFFNAMVAFGTFLNKKGQPLFNPNVTTESYTIFYNVANIEVFTQAFAALIVPGTGPGSTTAGVSSVILASGVRVTLRPTARISDDDWYVFRGDAPVKPTFQQMREPLRETMATEENSDHARNTGEESLGWETREGYGVNIPMGTVKVNN